MRRLSILSVRAGAVLAHPVYDGRGRLVLRAGSELSDHLLERLHALGIRTLWIEDPRSEGIEPIEPVNPLTESRILHVLHAMFTQGPDGPEFTSLLHALRESAGDLASQIGALQSPRVPLAVYPPAPPELPVHSLNVAVVALACARTGGRMWDRSRDLALGALLHDLGRAPALARGEPAYHPVVGWQAIKDDVLISALTKVIVLQHHERLDGSGYPAGLRGQDLHPLAQIVGLADAYVASLEGRDGTTPRPPHEILEEIMGSGGFEFDYDVVDDFYRAVAPYPPGAMVLLSNGRKGLVRGIDRLPGRPPLRLLAPDGEASSQWEDIELLSPGHQTDVIVAVLPE